MGCGKWKGTERIWETTLVKVEPHMASMEKLNTASSGITTLGYEQACPTLSWWVVNYFSVVHHLTLVHVMQKDV